MSTKEEWTKGPRAPPSVQGPIWNTGESRKQMTTGAGVFGQSLGRRLSISIGRYTTVFQAETTYAILACVCAVAYPGIFFGGVQQNQLRTEGRENGVWGQ
jgi:hypothetical protein